MADDGVGRAAPAVRFHGIRVRHRQPTGVFEGPLVCYQQLQQDQGQGEGPTAAAPQLSQWSLIEEITWL
jgi:hypothetical protein